MAKKRQLGFGTELVLMFLGIIAFIVVIWFGVGWLFTSTEASIARAEQERRSAIPLEKATDYDFKVSVSLESTYFGNQEFEVLEVGIADIMMHYDPQTDIYTWGLAEADQIRLTDLVRKWDTVFNIANTNAAMLTPQGLLPPIVKVFRDDSVPLEKISPILGQRKGKPEVENEELEITYVIHFGGDNNEGYETRVVNNGEVFYVTYMAPKTETERSGLQTSIPKDLVYRAVYQPFLEPLEPTEFSLVLAQIVSPEISTDESDALEILLDSIGNRESSEINQKTPNPQAVMTLHPKDENLRSLEIEKELVRALRRHIDILAAEAGVPVRASLIGYVNDFPLIKGFITGSGGGAKGSLDGNIFGGGLAVWNLGGAGLLDGSIDGSFTQDPIQIQGALSSFQVKEITVNIYFESP